MSYSELTDKKELANEDPTGNWNFSQAYSEQLIFEWFLKCSNYETLAKFGTLSILEEFQGIDPAIKNELRIKGLTRLVDGIIRIYKNSIFAIKYPTDKEKMKTLKVEAELIQSNLKLSYREMIRDETKQIQINEIVFNEFLNRLSNIIEQQKEYMNKSNLIFIYKPLFNAKEHKKKLMEEMAERG